MLYIRTDANPTIATGHVMRCMSIAKEVTKLGREVTFITADLQAKELIETNGFSLICLNSQWDNLESELEVLIELIKDREIDRILIDSYFVTENYLLQLRKYTKIYYLDDLAMFPYPVDVLINYNNYAGKLNYSTEGNCKETKYILGCKYAPLREEFRGIVVTPREKVECVLLTTGGSDSCHVASKFLTYLEQEYFRAKEKACSIGEMEFHVIVGKFNVDQDTLNELASKYPQIILHYNVTNMAEIMQSCDIAITAGGSTMYELCVCGVPMITYAFADNQLAGVEGFEELGVASYCGDIRDGEVELWRRIVVAIGEYCSDSSYRIQMAERMQEVVDGNGARRLAEVVTGLRDNKII
ncbi:UDP-2,4-diacetamido-2,4,6-trideoxy-beta-L-altropyranose hydrolase [Anaerosporobacter sp.]|uniref:UDP-2,4-diacetamido-2,4, 6-trideoxy-beta-L-altropyranose hydrolase n=1 Tax=Anaerosporobacter sp. TaxID=1872529 RepID=UPI00286F8E1B|nr:UDP-2,4-diacetamido-2,4,6-trideoxy-beta-L-altropyranose hydrolase [Anaerosporobacter sp.]